MENEDFDLGYSAFNDGSEQDENPYDEDVDSGAWEEWDRGWRRGEFDASQEMTAYCAGGSDWPTDEIEVALIIDGIEYNCVVEFEKVSEPYYGSEPYCNVTEIVCNRIKSSESENDDDCEDEDELTLEYEDLSDENKKIVDDILSEIYIPDSNDNVDFD